MTNTIYPDFSPTVFPTSRMSNHTHERRQNKHLMALLTFVGLLPLVYSIPPWIAQNISEDNRIVTLIAVGVIVPIISYVYLPLCLWALSKLENSARGD